MLAIATLAASCGPALLHAPPVKGTLHLFRPQLMGMGETAVVIKDGTPVAAATGIDSPTLLRARDKPASTLSSSKMLFGGDHVRDGFAYTDDSACTPLAISPGAVNGACLRVDGKGTLVTFRLSNPEATQHATAITVGHYSTLMMGFVSDTELAVVADDASCPFYKRSDGRFTDEPQARVKIIDMRGKLIRSGPCVHGIVVGDSKIAYLSHDKAENPLYSLDGHTWMKGTPVTFDGTGQLFVIDAENNLIDRRGRLIATNISGGYWTK